MVKFRKCINTQGVTPFEHQTVCAVFSVLTGRTVVVLTCSTYHVVPAEGRKRILKIVGVRNRYRVTTGVERDGFRGVADLTTATHGFHKTGVNGAIRQAGQRTGSGHVGEFSVGGVVGFFIVNVPGRFAATRCPVQFSGMGGDIRSSQQMRHFAVGRLRNHNVIHVPGTVVVVHTESHAGIGRCTGEIDNFMCKTGLIRVVLNRDESGQVF